MSDDIVGNGFYGPGLGGGPSGPGGAETLAQAYAIGAVAIDQTLRLFDVKGGAVVVDGSAPGFTGNYGFSVIANEYISKSLAIGVDSLVAPTARLHLPAGTAVAKTASMKIDPGVLLAIKESGAVESDGTNIYWTDSLGTRWVLNNSTSATLAQTYATGTVAFDQTFVLLDLKGGSVVVDGTNVGFTGAYAFDVKGIQHISLNLAVGVVAPTARVHVAASTAVAGTASLKVPSGVVLTVPEAGAIEADNNHIYWTDSGNARLQLDNIAVTPQTLATTYAFGSGAGDQTMVLTNVKGGGIVINATTLPPLFTSVTAFEIDVVGGSVNFYRVGGFDVQSTISKAAALGTTWNQVDFLSSTLTLTGAPTAITAIAQVHVGAGVVNGAGNTVADAYNLKLDAAPTGSATLTRSWSLGSAGAVQMAVGLVLGVGLDPPTESDLVIANGATVVSQANTGRLGYRTSTQQFYVSMNGAAYVPLLVGPAAGGFTQGSVPFGSATGTLAQDNAKFFWDDTNRRLGIGVTPTATLHIVQPAINAATPNAFVLVGGAHTAITANTEDIGADFDFSASKRWASGAIVTQREVVFRAPTYTFAGSSTISTAATLAITGQPIAGAFTSIVTPLAIWVQNGQSLLAQNNGTSNVNVLNLQNSRGNSGDSCTLNFLNTSVTNNPLDASGICSLVSTCVANSANFKILPANSTGIATLRFLVEGSTGNIAFGGSVTTLPASILNIDASKSVVSAAGAVWNGINIASSTLTLTGAATPVAALSLFNIRAPIVTASSAITITDFFACRIGTAIFVGAGPASATRNWSLGIDGNTKFSGGQTIHGTDVDAVGPYTILATDYYLHVRRTATSTISLNLPSIAVVGDGFVVMAKDSGYNAAVNNITWVPNGVDTIENVAGNYIQNIPGSLITFVSNATTNNWELS